MALVVGGVDRLFELQNPDQTEQNVTRYLAAKGDLSRVTAYLAQLSLGYFDNSTVLALNLYHIVLKAVTDKNHPEVKKIEEQFLTKIVQRCSYAPNLLYYALLNELYPLAEDFLRQGFSINRQEAGVGATALYLTCMYNDDESRCGTIQWLLEHGADHTIKRLDAEDETAFHAACYHGDIFVIDLLFRNGASIQQPTKQGQTPLHYAVTHPEAVNYLLLNGAAPNAQNRMLETPLHVVCTSEDIPHSSKMRSIRYLLDRGTDITLSDTEGKHALDGYFAVHKAQLEELVQLCTHFERVTLTNAVPDFERTLFSLLGKYKRDLTPTNLLLWLEKQLKETISKELFMSYIKEHIPQEWKPELEGDERAQHYLNKKVFDKKSGHVRRSILLEVLLHLQILRSNWGHNWGQT